MFQGRIELRALLFLLPFFLGCGEAERTQTEHNTPVERVAMQWPEISYDDIKDSCPTNDSNSPVSASDYPAYYTSLKRQRCYKDWTVLVYMQGDNELWPFALQDIQEMERQLQGENYKNRGSSTGKVDVLVQLDAPPSVLLSLSQKNELRRYHVFQTAKPYNDSWRNRAPQIFSPVVGSIEEKSHSEQPPEVLLKDFLEWGVSYYPSRHYLVVLWNHGAGYLGRSSQKPEQQKYTGGIALDESQKNFIDMFHLNWALSETNKFLKDFRTNQKIDVLAMDACLMQSIEVNHALSNEVDYLIASSQLENGMGLPYRTILDLMNEPERNARLSPHELINGIPGLYRDSLRKGSEAHSLDSKAKQYFTYSGVIMSEFRHNKIQNWMMEFRKLVERLQEYTNGHDPIFQERRQKIRNLLKNSPRFERGMLDAGVFLALILRHLDEESGQDSFGTDGIRLNEQTQRTREFLRQTRIEYSYHGSDYRKTTPSKDPQSEYFLGHFLGISLWVPRDKKGFKHRYPKFQSSSFFQAVPMWGEWLARTFNVPLIKKIN